MVGIPIVFVLISTIEMARGMWIYHTLAYAVKEGTRYAVARGQNSPTPITYNDVCNIIAQAGTGLLREDLTLTFYSNSLLPGGTTVTADKCTGLPWPPGDGLSLIDNQPGQTISIQGAYPFASAISMFWPGAGPGRQFAPLTLRAGSKDVMQF